MKWIESVYVASWFENAPVVGEVHERLLSVGLRPTSSWITVANGAAEDFALFTPERLRELAEQNDRDVGAADALLVLAARGRGGEMFAEVRLALIWQKPVYWVGRRILSAYRHGVVLCEDIDDALALMLGRAAYARSTLA